MEYQQFKKEETGDEAKREKRKIKCNRFYDNDY